MNDDFFQIVHNAIIDYDVEKELVFLIVGLCGHFECFVIGIL